VPWCSLGLLSQCGSGTFQKVSAASEWTVALNTEAALCSTWLSDVGKESLEVCNLPKQMVAELAS